MAKTMKVYIANTNDLNRSFGALFFNHSLIKSIFSLK